MKNIFLEFEKPIEELEQKIEQLRNVSSDSAVDISDEITRLQQKSEAQTTAIYAKLSPWQTALVARHPQRPYTMDYINEIFTDFHDNKKNAGVVEDKFAYIATLEEIKENDYNLNIPRYVDTYEEEAEIDLAEVQQKIAQLQNELADVQKQMDEYLKLF